MKEADLITHARLVLGNDLDIVAAGICCRRYLWAQTLPFARFRRYHTHTWPALSSSRASRRHASVGDLTLPELPLPKSFEDVELGTWVTKVPAAVAARTVDDHLELNPAVSVAGGAVAMHAAGTAAASQGLTVRMLVVLTDERIIICDWVDGSGPTRELEHFDRDSTEVSINKSGLARILKLSDAGTGLDLELSGSTSLLSRQAKADKDVLAHLFDGVT